MFGSRATAKQVKVLGDETPRTIARELVVAVRRNVNGRHVRARLNLTDGQPHKIALYAVDFDAAGRVEQIEVIDGNPGGARHALTTFGTGHYVVWTITGHVIFRVTRTAGVNVVLSGIFID